MNMNKQKIIISILAVLIVGFGAWLSYSGKIKKTSPVASVEKPSITTSTYVNKRGENWTITQGEYAFTVSSASELPRIVSGKIDPLDVKVGDIQKMKIVVMDVMPLRSAIAEIETDNGTTTLPMRLTETKMYTYADSLKEEYIVDAKGNLVANTDANSLLKNAFGMLARPVSAAGENLYTYEVDWVVKDTHVAVYHTRFIVESENNNKKDEITLAWSDPCQSWDQYGSLTTSCSANNEIIGVDASNMTISGKSLTLTNSTMYVTSGYSLSIVAGGSVIIGSGSSIKVAGFLFMVDYDQDGYPGSTQLYWSSMDLGFAMTFPKKRVSQIPYANRIIVDCNDAAYSTSNSCGPTCDTTNFYPSMPAGCTTITSKKWSSAYQSYTTNVIDPYNRPLVRYNRYGGCEGYGGYTCAGIQSLVAANYGCGYVSNGESYYDDCIGDVVCSVDYQVYCKYQ